MDKAMKTILITGSSGLVGSEAVDFFREKGWKVIGIDANMRSQFFGIEQKEPEYFVDIRNEEVVDMLFAGNKFDAIIHAAAQPSHDYSKDHALEDFDINARGTLILLEATRRYCPEAVFVYVSTDKVYGGNMSRSLDEKRTRWHSEEPFNELAGLDAAGCRSLFGCSKTAADIYVQEYGNYFGMKTACFRCGCITGRRHAGAEEHGFLAYLAKCVKEERLYRIFGYKGKQVRDLIHSYDLVNAFYHFIENPRIGVVYNMGGGEDRSVSVLEAITLLEKETGKQLLTEYVDEHRKGDRIWDVHDVRRFRDEYPEWDYKYSLQDIIKDVCQ
jgi:CDP-paratose 2-epimerase